MNKKPPLQMPTTTTFSVLDLLDLVPVEREIFLEIARNGPLSSAALASSCTRTPLEIETALEQLATKKRIRRLPDARYDVVMGKTRPHSTLPAQLWPALLAPQRLYSEQEIAILRIAIPMLQFVRATLSSFADHGPNHALRVKTIATQLGYAVGLTDTERRSLRTAALFHDIGNVIERERHHQISQETVEKLAALGNLPLSAEEVALVGLLCRWHRKEYEPDRIDFIRGEKVRTGMAASVLRVADAMDIDSRRSDYDTQYRIAMEFFFPEKREYFTSLEEIYGVRVVYDDKVNIQVFTHGAVPNNIQIQQLHNDLGKTPLAWSVQEIAIPALETKAEAVGRAVIAFPFDPHSLVMTALSRSHLQAAGYAVELLCYPDTPDDSDWLWGSALNELEPAEISQLVVIGDRPEPDSMPQILHTLDHWLANRTHIHILNRHEASWARVRQLQARGVTVTLGTDWAYFLGNHFTPTEFEWATLAALTTRDPTMASLHVSADTTRVLQGLLCAVLDAEQHDAHDTAEWHALAEPLLDRIAANDREFFAARADEFVERYATPSNVPRIEGRVLIFDGAPGPTPQAFYWIMEKAMQDRGFTFERELRLSVPYAIVTRPVGDKVELVAASHWRATHVPPIRLLYPDIQPQPHGTESVINVQLSPAQAELVISKLVEACNRV